LLACNLIEAVREAKGPDAVIIGKMFPSPWYSPKPETTLPWLNLKQSDVCTQLFHIGNAGLMKHFRGWI